MSRIVSIWLPAWPIDRLRRTKPGLVPDHHPFALVEKGPHGLRIHAVNAKAGEAGVRAGMPLADVRAGLPEIAVRPAAPRADAEALQRLVRWLGRYSPTRNVDGDDGAWIDITGAAHLFGGEVALLEDLVRRLSRLGIEARAGLADTFGAAHALARWATTAHEPLRVASAKDGRSALAVLPVAALRLSPATVQLLSRLGLKRIGLLYAVPRSALERRFREASGRTRTAGRDKYATEAAAVLLRLDQALGTLAEPKPAMVEPPEAAVRLSFPEPIVSHAGIMAAVDRLAHALCDDLAARCQGAARFRLALYRSDGSCAEVRVGMSAPGRDPGHLARLLGEKLAAIDAGFGLDLLILEAGRVERLVSRQPTLAASAGAPERMTNLLLDRLANRLGTSRIVRIGEVGSHVPERAERIAAALLSEPPRERSGETLQARTAAPPPPLLIVPPEPASVVAEIPDGAPVRLLWRRLSRRITRAEGPRRIAPEWWRAIAAPEKDRPLTRDYYRLEDETGAGYWVYRDGFYGEHEDRPPRWFVHGVWA